MGGLGWQNRAAVNTCVCSWSLGFVLFCFSEFHVQMDVVL